MYPDNVLLMSSLPFVSPPPFLVDCALVNGGNSTKSPLQSFLMEFLESLAIHNSYEKSSQKDVMEIDGGINGINTNNKAGDNAVATTTIQNVARFFGELQRCGIFSHDSYVRYPL